MGMMQQVLSPGMEDGKKPDLCSEMLGVGCDLQKGLRRSTEQDVIDDLLILQSKRGEQIGQGKDHMVVFHRKDLLLTRMKPPRLGQRLTFGTVSVPA